MEEAEAYAILVNKYNLTQLAISKKVSKSRSEIANKIRLIKLPEIVQKSLKKNKLHYGHARALLSLSSSTKILKTYHTIVSKGLSVRQTEALIQSSKKQKIRKRISFKKYTKQVAWLKQYLNTNVKIVNSNNNKIIIEFSNDKELELIINKIINE